MAINIKQSLLFFLAISLTSTHIVHSMPDDVIIDIDIEEAKAPFKQLPSDIKKEILEHLISSRLREKDGFLKATEDVRNLANSCTDWHQFINREQSIKSIIHRISQHPQVMATCLSIRSGKSYKYKHQPDLKFCEPVIADFLKIPGAQRYLKSKFPSYAIDTHPKMTILKNCMRLNPRCLGTCWIVTLVSLVVIAGCAVLYETLKYRCCYLTNRSGPCYSNYDLQLGRHCGNYLNSPYNPNDTLGTTGNSNGSTALISQLVESLITQHLPT